MSDLDVLAPWQYENQTNAYLAGSLSAMAEDLDEIEVGAAIYKYPASLARLFRTVAARLERV